ncbi:MAG: sensor domain-containing diguanylate cyclase [Anaerolineales bacterium]
MPTLKDSELRYRRLFEAAQDGIFILNAETGVINDVNPYLIKMLGYSREEFMGKKLWEMGAFKDIEANKMAFEALQSNEYIRYEDLPLKAKDGHLMQVEFVSNVYQVEKERVIQCNIRDITKRKQAEDALRASEALLREQAVRDHLTGLFNRRYLEATLERELMRATREQRTLGVVMLDVDNFKYFNGTYGHAAGDAILCELGRLLLEVVRGEDISCRYGGDEIVIVLSGASQKVTQRRAELICEHAKQVHIQLDGQSLVGIKLSYGIAIFPKDGRTYAEILRYADDALYAAKREKRGDT